MSSCGPSGRLAVTGPLRSRASNIRLAMLFDELGASMRTTWALSCDSVGDLWQLLKRERRFLYR